MTTAAQRSTLIEQQPSAAASLRDRTSALFSEHGRFVWRVLRRLGVTVAGELGSISGHAASNSSCEPQTDHLVGNGVFDIGRASTSITRSGNGDAITRSDACANPYTMNLVVDTTSDDLILFDEAAVTL